MNKKPNAFSVALAAARNKDGASDEAELFGSPNETREQIEDEANPAVSDGGDNFDSEDAVAAPVEAQADATEAAVEVASPPEASSMNGFEPPMRSVKMGRPTGKRSDPNYMQMTAYIPIDVHEDVKEELLRVNRDRRRQKLPALEISDVVETQLGAWLQTQRGERTNV